MPHGPSANLLRERLRAYINRMNGEFPDSPATMPDVLSVDELPRYLSNSRAILYNDDGTPWTPQNVDGSFPFLPGYDGPVEP